MMILKNGVSFSGCYSLKKITKEGSEVSLGEHKNLLTNHFYEKLNSNVGDLFNRCYVGTGTTPPELTDLYLENAVSDYSTKTYLGAVRQYDPETKTASEVVGVRFVFPIGYIDTNITEIGLRHGSSSYLTTRSLVVDEFGNPSSVSIDSGEKLIVEYRLSVTDIPTEGVSTIDIVDKNDVVVDTVDVTYTLIGESFDSHTNSSNSIGDSSWFGNSWCLASSFPNLVMAPAGSVITPSFGSTPVECGYPSSVVATAVEIAGTTANISDGLVKKHRLSTSNGNQSGGFTDILSYGYGGYGRAVFWSINFSKPIMKTDQNVFEFSLSSKVTEI